MVRNILLLSLLLSVTTGLSVAEEATPPPAVQEITVAADAYDATPLPYDETDAHLDDVYFYLDYLDGRILAGDIQGEDTWLLFWNADTQSLEATFNDEPVELIQSEDKSGRIAFASDLISGWIDIADGYVQTEVELSGEPTLRYVGLLSDALDEPDAEIPVSVVASEEKCICKGTNEKHGCNKDTDCTNAQACSYTKDGENHNSKCIWAHVPVTKIGTAAQDSLNAIAVEPVLPAAQ